MGLVSLQGREELGRKLIPITFRSQISQSLLEQFKEEKLRLKQTRKLLYDLVEAGAGVEFGPRRIESAVIKRGKSTFRRFTVF